MYLEREQNITQTRIKEPMEGSKYKVSDATS